MHLHKARETARACRRVASGTHSEIVYLGCEGDWGLVYTAALVSASRLFGHQVLLHHHSFSYIDSPSRLMNAIVTAGGNQLRHIFLCGTMRERFESRYGEVPHSHIVSNAAFVETPSRQQSSAAPGPIRIGLLSNLTREKGLYTFIELLRRLKSCNLNVEGLLAGPIIQQKDRDMVAAAEDELEGVLQYLGPLYGEDKNHFYHQIDVFVFPTEYANEAQPTVLFEALAAGASVIAFDRGCIGVQIKESGMLIPISEDFCTRACEYLAHLMQRPRDRANLRTRIKQNFDDARALALASVRGLISPEATRA